MNFLRNLLGTLAFRSAALRTLADRGAVVGGLVAFAAGFLVFSSLRMVVYSPLEPSVQGGMGFLATLFHLNLIQATLFFAVVYVPAEIVLGNLISGDGLGLYVSGREYRAHLSALLPLWGFLFFIAAPLQWLLPQFLILGNGLLGISIGLLALLILMSVYSTWAICRLNFLSAVAGLGVFVFSWLTLPVFYFLTYFIFALPLFILIPIGYLVYIRIRRSSGSRMSEREFQHQLHMLTINPQDADAHHQLGLLHLKRRNLDAAQRYFNAALKIDPGDPDYHYYLGRVFEIRGEWAKALQCYEETYRINPEYALGDIFREVGKGYLHAGRIDKAIEFLRFFLESRGSDPEGRYWLAVALQRSGDPEGMKAQLNTLLVLARSNPRFFRRENREWLYRARVLLRP